MARTITTVSDGFARVRTRYKDHRRHAVLLSSAEAVIMQAATKSAVDVNARRRDTLATLRASVGTVPMDRVGRSLLHDVLSSCVEPATSLDRSLCQLDCQPEVKNLHSG